MITAPRWPCRLFPHNWTVTDRTELEWDNGQWHRELRRCTRCGYLIHQYHAITPPKRGLV